MKKPTKSETAFRALERIAFAPITPEAVTELRHALAGSVSLLASKAADIAAAKGVHELIPDMVGAFERFLVDGAHTDKLCNAKISVAKALNTLEFMGDSVFLKGAYYVQKEPAYGEPIDTAIELRCNCAHGLARIVHPDAHAVLADMLVDREPPVRVAAAKGLTYLGSRESELLLRLKVLTGDREIDVMSECLAGLVTIAPDRSVEFAARFLRSEDIALAESAALAIGQSHSPAAYALLRKCWDDDPLPDRRRSLLLPIALLRTDDAFDFLLDVVRTADVRTSTQAVSALSLYASGSHIESIREAVLTRREPDILDRFEREFR